MSLIAIAGFYFVLWWLVLFAVLPFFMTVRRTRLAT